MIGRKIEENHGCNIDIRSEVTAVSAVTSMLCFMGSIGLTMVLIPGPKNGDKLFSPKGFVIAIAFAAILPFASFLFCMVACHFDTSTSDCKEEIESITALHPEPSGSEQKQISSNEIPPPSYEDAIKNTAHSKTTVTNSNPSPNARTQEQSKHSLNATHKPSVCHVAIHTVKNVFHGGDLTIVMS